VSLRYHGSPVGETVGESGDTWVIENDAAICQVVAGSVALGSVNTEEIPCLLGRRAEMTKQKPRD
jgi:hypothetical protein